MSDIHRSPISPGLSLYEAALGERPRFAPLPGSRHVDVAIVGGGFTGLSAAFHLAGAGVSVALFEAHRLGDGASGRNGGQMGTGHRLWPEELEKAYGRERARALFDLAEAAKTHLLDFAREQAIDIAYRPGQLSVAHKARFADDYRRHVETLNERYDYAHAKFMDSGETAARLGSPAYFSGVRDTGTGHLDPLRLLLGTARAAAAAGAAIHEETRVLSLRRAGGRIELETATGTVSADRALLAVNAHGGGLHPALDAHVLPIRSFIAATEPLDEPERVIPGGEAVDDSRFVVRYFRKSPDGRLVFGGREAYSSADAAIEPQIRRQIEATWPHLKAVPIAHAWGGSVAVTMNRMPYVAEVEPGITAIGGYSGHGVMLANFCGRLYAERICGDGDRLRSLEELRIPAFPGGSALRSPLLFLAMTWFSLRDRL